MSDQDQASSQGPAESPSLRERLLEEADYWAIDALEPSLVHLLREAAAANQTGQIQIPQPSVVVPPSPPQEARETEIRERLEASEREVGEDESVRRCRYDHGGGRMFREAPAPLGGGRNLILDVYDEGCREFFFAARADVRYLLAALDQVRKERDELMVDRERLDRQVILAVDDYNEMKARSETAEREREEARANEKELSAAYLRIRQLVGAWDTNHGGENRFEVTEKKIRDLISQLPPSP